MLGGTSRFNASLAVATFNGVNATLTQGQSYTIDVSADAMLILVPSYN